MITKQVMDLNNTAPDSAVDTDQPVVPASVSTRKRRGGRPAATQTEAGDEQEAAAGAAHGDGTTTSCPVNTGRAEAIAAGSNTASTADAGSDSQVEVREMGSGVPSRKNNRDPKPLRPPTSQRPTLQTSPAGSERVILPSAGLRRVVARPKAAQRPAPRLSWFSTSSALPGARASSNWQKRPAGRPTRCAASFQRWSARR